MKNYFACTNRQQICTAYVLEIKRELDFFQMCARLIQPSCNQSVKDLLSLTLCMGAIRLASLHAAPQ